MYLTFINGLIMSIDIYTLIFAALAIFLVFKLRSVLGSTNGEEGNLMRPANPPPNDNVIPFEKPVTSFKWKGYAEEGSPVAVGLDEIITSDPQFDLPAFISGAKAAYEMFTASFAKGDRAALKPYIAPDVFSGFEQVITQREQKGERVDYRFIGIDKTTITEAGIDTTLNEYEITIAFVAQVVTATFSNDNMLIDGDATKVTEVRDNWTFARKVGAPDPNWQLVGTADA
jgi:predicted lipid-binding transport protein (Tim44 family)